ncbi:hypothetical protein FF2_032276 [Malus domestica]
MISFSRRDSSLASWVLFSSSSSSSAERLAASRRRSSRVWERKELLVGGRVWSLPIRVWSMRLSKLVVLVKELIAFGFGFGLVKLGF